VAAQDVTTSADLRGMGFLRALDTLMLQNDLFFRVTDPTSIMVFKKTPQNLNDHEYRPLRTFYLTYADVDGIRQHLNALLPQLRVFVDRRLSAVTVVGSADDLAKVQQVISNLDKTKGEVTLDMEILEVPHTAALAAGILAAPSVSPDKALAKLKETGDAKLLAHPTLRVVAGESAEVRIGRKPLPPPPAGEPTSVRNASTAASDAPAKTLRIEEPGLRIKAKARLHPDHTITLDLEYQITDPAQPGDPERSIKTTVRVKDGEGTVLGGLLEEVSPTTTQAKAKAEKQVKDRILAVKASALRLAAE
jgi:general secretion pathway protein D